MAVTIEELTDERWAKIRDEVAQQWLGVSADEFVARFTAGEYDEDEPDALMSVLAFFPELD